MSNLISIGNRYDHFATISAISTSPDGYSWVTPYRIDQPFLPFKPRLPGTGIRWSNVLPWIVRQQSSFGNLNGVAWGDLIFVAVGDNGVVVTSDHAEYWFEQASGVTENLRGITWGGTLWVAVGDAGTIITSPDSINWTEQTSEIDTQLTSVAWSIDLQLFIAVGLSGVAITSPDGVTWTTQNSGTANNLRSITWSDGVWTVGGWSNQIQYWQWGYFTAVGDIGTILTTVDGVTWTTQNSNVVTGLNSVSWSSYGTLAVGNAATFISSTDSVTWSQGNISVTNELYSVCGAGEQVDVMVGASGVILRSTDNTNAYSDTSQVSTNLYSVTYSEYLNLFVAVGQSGMIMTSSIENPTEIFTAISDSGYISASYDSNVWTNGTIIDGNFSPRALELGLDNNGYNISFMVAGVQKYASTEPSHAQWDEVGQIFVSSNAVGAISVDDPGFYDSPWNMVYSHDSNSSIFHGLRHFKPDTITVETTPSSNSNTYTSSVSIDILANPSLSGLANLLASEIIESVGTVAFSSNSNIALSLSNVVITDNNWEFGFQGNLIYTTEDTVTFVFTHPEVWVAVGADNKNPLIVYSLDTGETWDVISNTVPSLFAGRALFDITYTNYQFYISAYGVVIYSYSIINPTWNASNFVTSVYGNPNFTKIAANPSGQLVAAGSGLLFYSFDGEVWASYYQPGYQFVSVIWYIDHWVAGATSLLTNHTYFTSKDLITWTGQNNTMHMYDFAIIP